MCKILTVKDGKYGLGYEYFLTELFQHFGIPLEVAVKGIIKQTFSLSTLVEYECEYRKIVHLSRISELLAKHERLNKRLRIWLFF